MRLSALFEEFTQYLKVERGASHRSIDTYRRYFGYFQNFAKDQIGGSVLIAHFSAELCRSYQYFMASKELQPGSIRVRLAVPAGSQVSRSGRPSSSSLLDALDAATRPWWP